MTDLKAIVYGTGFAGQGHAQALRSCGVEVVCIVGRTPEVTELVADVRGEENEPYQTFFDGWRYQVGIDAVRAASGWVELPAQR